MPHPKQRWQFTLVLVLMLSLIWFGTGLSRVAMADPRLESRLNRLESDLGRLRSTVNRLESQLTLSPPSSRPPVGSPGPNITSPSTEEQFDNLATLAVETKLQVRQLENRVAQLEQALAP